MFKIFGTAYPQSGISEARVGITIPAQKGLSEDRTVDVFISQRTTTVFNEIYLDNVGSNGTVEMQLWVETFGAGGGRATVYGYGVPNNGELHVLGIRPHLFLGNILHEATPKQKCTLRCNPTSQEVERGKQECIECSDNGGPIYHVCCR